MRKGPPGIQTMPAGGASGTTGLETRVEESLMNRSWVPWPVIKTRTMPPPGGKARFRRGESWTHGMSWRVTAELLLGSRLAVPRSGQPLRGPEPLRHRGTLREELRVHGVLKSVGAL